MCGSRGAMMQMVGGGKFVRRAINTMVRQTVNSMVPTFRRVHIPTVERT